ncbi:amino acid ABC transporter permease [Sulfitobacter guttiformis]|uniref:Amino acid ABC transporter membrane protein (PAAT family) n=1 Tax=Sulfitobacter guttiformis TaxID=74349 RepID=A0A420DU98_9RHOB|nr:amino acid ABC transporter permease [Sulfitobacter guttiformis]KIN71217.1 ABC-type glutamine transport system, permease component [Sulfitobacter guttiformis KCTC 32187]RKE97687.1 amino acid ABC transporter membrane protein (PAAT family) [Sulfitobacter guttiformis]
MKNVLALICLTALTGCGTAGNWGWYVIDPTTTQGWNNITFLLDGFGATITLSVIAAIMSMVIGLMVALPGMSTNRWIRMPSRVYVEFVRAIPLLPMLFWVFYGLPVVLQSMGISVRIDAFWGAVITLAISDSAFTAEIYRSGIQSIARGQTEAAKTIGLTYTQTMRYVVLPQAIRRILPPLANQFIYIVKMSAFASVIGMQELTRRANELVVTEYRPLEIYSLLILEYLVLVLIISFFVRWLERKMGADESR